MSGFYFPTSFGGIIYADELIVAFVRSKRGGKPSVFFRSTMDHKNFLGLDSFIAILNKFLYRNYYGGRLVRSFPSKFYEDEATEFLNAVEQFIVEGLGDLPVVDDLIGATEIVEVSKENWKMLDDNLAVYLQNVLGNKKPQEEAIDYIFPKEEGFSGGAEAMILIREMNFERNKNKQVGGGELKSFGR